MDIYVGVTCGQLDMRSFLNIFHLYSCPHTFFTSEWVIPTFPEINFKFFLLYLNTQYSILNTQYIILNTQYSILNTYSIFNTQYIILNKYSILTFSSSAHLKQLHRRQTELKQLTWSSYTDRLCQARQLSVMSWLVVIALCVGVVYAVPSPILGMSTSPCHIHANSSSVYSCLMFSLPTPAPLRPLEHTEHTIPEEYIVVFKDNACKKQGMCMYIEI